MHISRIHGRILWHSFWWMVLLLAGVSIGACTTPKKPPVLEPPPKTNAAELDTWDEGVQAFRKGDYNKAMALFEFLSESTGDETIYRKALYGLASTRLILAQNAGEFNEALDLWDCWSQQVPSEIEMEDPRLMTPFLDRVGSFFGPEGKLKKEGKPKDKTVYKNHLVYRDAVVYKNLLEGKEKEIERLKSRIEAKERDVRRLRHQIESLEAIHLKFQEKQKEISSP